MIRMTPDIDDLVTAINKLDYSRKFIFIDEKVSRGFPELQRELSKNFIEYLELSVDPNLKSMANLQKILDYLLSKNINRNSLIIAIGGGTLSDLVGFAASIILRGVAWVCVPTTLLSMVDAGIGGKTAIDSPYGKNLIGSFHAPQNVFLRPLFLKHLPETELMSGYGEIVKYGILSPEIAADIFSNIKLESLVEHCANYKQKIVTEDFHDRGNRKFLNLGHTLGHALEMSQSIDHGVAVFWGIYWEHILFAETTTAMKIFELARHLGVKFKPKILTLAWLNLGTFITLDKKVSSETEIEIPLVNQHGQQIIIKTPLADLKNRIDNSAGAMFAD